MEAAQAAGNLVGGIASYETGKYNRSAARTEATEAERAGAAEESRIRDAARMAIGNQVNAQGSNGFQQGTGSALDALTQSQINAALDGLSVRSQAAGRARSARVSGDLAYAAGKNAMVQGMFGAAAKGIDWASSRSAAQSGVTPSGGYGGNGPAPTWGQPGHEDRRR